ncbi:MAG: flagellar basal body-associated FliL family protein [Pseudomonadota bacterium]
MSDASVADAEENDEGPNKSSKMPLIIGLALFLILGGAGFFVTYSGLVGGSGGEGVADKDSGAEEETAEPLPDIAFVPIDPLVISLNTPGKSMHLRFRGYLEIVDGQADSVTTLMPRIVDVLNGYLRALSSEELQDPSKLLRMRAQMLRRVQLVVGEGRVRDLLVSEFVIN